MKKHPLQVYLTVDTEASIAGAFADVTKKPQLDIPVDCMVGNQSEGLGFLLRTLQHFGLRATFFTESLQSRYFGVEPMQKRAAQIIAAGQDLQLHVHPCWLSFTDGLRNEIQPNDASTGRLASQLTAIFQEAVDRFEAWGFGKPVAVRTGNFSTGLDTFTACREAGLIYSSNIAAPLHPGLPTQLQLHQGFHLIDGVLELPLSSFWSYSLFGKPHRRIMAITACSTAELSLALEQAWQQDVEAVCILTHPFEFAKIVNEQSGECRRNKLNQSRFINICRLIAENPTRYQCATFSELPDKKHLIQQPEIKLQNNYLQMLVRTLQNGLNDKIC